MKQRLLIWLTFFFAGAMSIYAQDYSFRGRVLDSTGEPLIGATVRTKEKPTNGVVTDIDGNFVINVAKGNTLEVTYVGYNSQEVAVTGQNDITITLSENSQVLEDVVVIGYGTMRKKDLTGSVTQINPDKIADQNPGTVQDLLRGTPGLQIGYDASAKGSGASIKLRGENSLGTNVSPMIVLDGMPFYGELSEINPDDIGQIDILKDASSTAIYGARAASGVIIITTKKGKTGKPTVNLSANFGVTNKSAYRDYMNADEYMRYREDYYMMNYTYGMGDNGLYGYYNVKDSNGNLAYPQGYFNNPSRLTGSAVEEWQSNTGVSGFGAASGESALSLYARRLEMNNADLVFENFLAGRIYDWNDATFRTGLNQDYNVSLSGATDHLNYYLSAGYLRNEGAVRGNDYKAFRANMKLNAKVTSWLELGANVNFQERTDGDIQVSLGSNYWDNNMLRNSPYASMYTEDGGYQQYPMTGKQTNGGYNYFFDRQFYDLDKGYTNLNTIFTAKVNLPYGFTYSFNISPRYQWFHDYYFMDSALPNAAANSRGVNREHYKAFEWNLNNTLTWDKEYGDVHHVQVTLVQEAEDHKTYKDRIEARNISPTDALGFHWTDGANKEQSGFYTYDSHYSGASYLGRAFYSYDNRYMITASFRRDGFSGFGRNNVWGNFGAVGLGWNFSDEKFMESTRDWLNNAKLRLSWGTNGNRDFGANGSTDPYLTMANLSMGGSMVYFNDGTSTIVKSLYMNRLAAPNLRWEKTEAYNIGLDFGVIDHRLTGAIDWYFKKTRDMIMNQRLPSFTGFSSIYANLGEVQNSGIEISLSSVNIEKQNFTWTTSAGFSYNRNRINHIYYDYDENGKENDDTSNGWYIGHPIGEIWYYESDGVWQNTPEDIAQAALVGQRPGDPKVKNNYTEDDRIVTNADGTTTRIPVYNDKDKTYLGTTNPPIYWNLKNDFVLWKDLTISFSLYSYMGHKSLASYWLNQDNGGSQVINACNLPAKEYWTPENATNDYCRIMAVGPNTGLAGGVSKLYNRNFVRLDNISIGYTLPQAWTRKAMLEKVRFTVSCNNVCTISGWEYGDPETGGLARRTFNFGVNVTF